MKKKLLPILLSLSLAACGEGGTPATPPAVRSIDDLSGVSTATVGQPVQVRIRLVSETGAGVSGVAVTFTPQSGGSAEPESAISGPDGEATTTWTLGTEAGLQQLRVSAGGQQRILQVDALPEAASAMTRASGNEQAAAPGTRLPLPLIVRVADAYDNPVSGQAVEFDVVSGGGAVDPQVASTAADGTAATTWTLGATPGVQQLQARSAGLATVSFSATALLPGELLSIVPTDWEMPPGQQVTFAAWTASSANLPLDWYVNGVPGGDAVVGGIQSGVYTAPANPALPSVTVRAVNPVTGASAESTVRFIAAPTNAPTLSYTDTRPRVINRTSTDSLEVRVAVQGYSPGINLEAAGQPTLQFQAWQTGIYRLSIAAGRAVAGYIEGDLHNFVGFLVPLGSSARYNYFVNVRDATVPDVIIVPVATDAQRSDYVLNLRDDQLRAGHKPELLARLYEIRPDGFDVVAIIEPVDFFQNRSYMALRNDVSGLGLGLFDNATGYGSPERLKGMVRFPIAGYFDGAETAFSHEVGHRWINFLRNDPLAAGIPHWPPSSLARGVMGFNIPGSGAGGTFPWDVVPRSDGTFELACTGVTREFSDLSLYLMGLIPPDSVRPHYVLNDPGVTPVCGSTVQATTVTIDDVIAANGPRIPDHASSQRDFAAATIVLSAGRLLDADEMAFFSHMARRAESRTELHFTSGFSSGLTRPFFLATGGRATMATRIW